ncbi:hypothetical protein ACFX13_034743 [Malus domestica]
MIKAAVVEMGKILSLFMVEANKNNIDDNGISRLPTRRAALHPYIIRRGTRRSMYRNQSGNACIDLLHFVDVEVQSSY